MLVRKKLKWTYKPFEIPKLVLDEWRKIGDMDITMWGKSFYVGLATLSHDNSQLTKAQYSQIDLQK